MPSALARRATLTLAVLYLVFGVVEVATHRDDTLPALLFWGVSLLGGGSAVLAGVLTWAARPRTGTVLVVLGALLGLLATAWTLLLPLLAIGVIVLALREYATLAGGGADQQRRESGPTTRSGDQEGNASA